jgi:tetratricopeptide (TPR) repeat protein
MQNRMKDIRFITLPEDRDMGSVTLSKDIPLPIQFPEGSVTDDIDVNSIVAGLIKVVAWDTENKNYEYYKKILLEIQPDVVKELNIAAIAQSKKGDFDFAEELMLAVNHLSDAPESYINLAVLYAQMTVKLHKDGDDTRADMYDDRIIAVLNECKERHEKYAATYSEISAFHMRHGDVETARDYLSRYTELETDKKKKADAQKALDNINRMLSSKDQIMYAYDKMMTGCADEALEIMNKYIAGNEKRWESFFLRGWAKRVLEDFRGAQEDLLESLRIDGKNAEVYNELSICARESGDTELAKSYLQIAVDLDGEDVIYLTNLAFLHLASGEFAESRELLEKARTIDPEDPQLKYLMEEYQKSTGDKIGDIISEEVYSDEELEALKDSRKNNGIPYREI